MLRGWKNHTKHSDFDAMESLGYLPMIVMPDGGKISDQNAMNYAHGGGYSPFGGEKWTFDPVAKTLKFPGDPLFRPIASLDVGEETLYFYQSAVCAIVQKDGTFDVIRTD